MEALGFDFSVLINKGATIIGNLIAALVIFWIGKLVANKVSDIARGMMEKGKLDPTLVSFLGNVTFGIMMMVVMMATLNRLGVDTTSIVAIMGGAAVAIGLALQDQLSNFAAGVLIILFRPFSKGDYVGVNGHEGTVYDISLITTSLMTLNNHEIVIPNSQMTTNSMVNYSSLPNRRVDLVIGISYDSDIRTAKNIMLEVANKHRLIFSDPEPSVMVSALNDSSVDLLICVWTSNDDWLKVQCDLNEDIKYAFDENDIEIPFPHQVVHMINKAS